MRPAGKEECCRLDSADISAEKITIEQSLIETLRVAREIGDTPLNPSMVIALSIQNPSFTLQPAFFGFLNLTLYEHLNLPRSADDATFEETFFSIMTGHRDAPSKIVVCGRQ